MKASEIREMSYEEMAAQLQSLKEELFNLRFQLAANQLENTARLKAVKKDIARVRSKGGFPPKRSGTTELYGCVSRHGEARFLFSGSRAARLPVQSP